MIPGKASLAAGLAAAVLAACGSAVAAPGPPLPANDAQVSQLPPRALRPLLSRRSLDRIWTIHYLAHDFRVRRAFVILPRWYGPHDDPPIPLVISPHGRGVSARFTVRLWGNLPALGPFAVVCPEGQGRRLTLFSWGDPGEIDDLARMPTIAHEELPWLHVDQRRVYAVGGSMGGQETLLLDALHPRLLAGAVALDSATNMAARYRAFSTLPGRQELQKLARAEVGGTPNSAPAAYAARSPLGYARILATDGVPLYIWWSTRDLVVVDQNMESGLLYREIKRINPAAPVYQYIGSWAHSTEMNPLSQLPSAVVELGLISLDQALLGAAVSEGFAAPQMQDGIATLLLPVQIPEQIPVPGGVAHSALTAALRVPTGVVQVLSELRVPHPHSAGPAGRAATTSAPSATGQAAAHRQASGPPAA